MDESTEPPRPVAKTLGLFWGVYLVVLFVLPLFLGISPSRYTFESVILVGLFVLLPILGFGFIVSGFILRAKLHRKLAKVNFILGIICLVLYGSCWGFFLISY